VREPSRFEVWYGRDAPPPPLRELRAGPVTAVLDGIDLRYVRVGDVEVVRRLFVAVRDAAWVTVPPVVSGLEIEEQDGGFRVQFEAYHESGELRFRWRGMLSGEADGRLEVRMDGRAESDFQYNRIGFCVLHPSENAGRPYRTRTPDGEQRGRLPDLIGKQEFEEGKLHPLFPSYDRLEIDVADGLRVRFDFEGDLFEMEDQRNWTDASFKTYSTQITLGWPWDARAGQSLVQSVRLTPDGEARRPGREGGAVRIELAGDTRRPLPPIGLSTASHGRPLGKRELALLQELHPAHLRVDLDLAGEWRDRFEQADTEALTLDAGLELALRLGEEPEDELRPLAAALHGARIERVIVLRAGETVTAARWVRLAREVLEAAVPGAAFAGGTDLWFTELNREPPVGDGLDAVAYSLAATVHADDDLSLRETPSVQSETVRAALALYGGLPVFVGPVTIRPRIWPFGDPADPRGLPFQVDQRQCALLGAGWTVASSRQPPARRARRRDVLRDDGLARRRRDRGRPGGSGALPVSTGPGVPSLPPARGCRRVARRRDDGRGALVRAVRGLRFRRRRPRPRPRPLRQPDARAASLLARPAAGGGGPGPFAG
jgi:hypothetical protein